MDNTQDFFNRNYDRFVDKVYRFCFIKVNNRETAEDITSETFLRYWEALNKKGREIDNCQAFIFSIARNLVIDHYRQKGKAQFVSADDIPIADTEIDLLRTSFINSDMAQARLAISKLNSDYQDIIIWHYIDDLTIPEIARAMNKSEGSVRVMLSRALNSLREKIGDNASPVGLTAQDSNNNDKENELLSGECNKTRFFTS